MPDKLTDNEIVKAKELIKKLEEAYDNYYDSSKGMPYDIDTTLLHSAICFKNCLNEINRLQAKNSNLTSDLTSLQNDLTSLQAENERLKEEIKKEQLYNLRMTAHSVKAEAYKEFAERLKAFVIPQKADGYVREIILKSDIDNLLKELVGEQPPLNDVKCIDCEYLEFKTPYAVCSKAYKGIVSPDDSCGKGKLKETVGEDNSK